MPGNARDIAVGALRDRAGNVSAHLNRTLGGSKLSTPDKGLAAELALGALRRRATLEAVLQAFLNRPHRRLPTPLTEILHVALYQLLFLDRVPDFAVVNETVEQAGRFHHRRQSGLVNGVLRSVLRKLSEPQAGKPALAANVIPVGLDSYRTVETAVFPDPAVDPAGYLAEAFSLPPLLADRWVRRLGSLEAAAQVAAHANTRAPLIVRVNSLKAGVDEARDALAAQGADVLAHVNGLSLVVSKAGGEALTNLPAFADGLIQPQDPVATAVGLAAKVRGGMRVLDFCAAPGTKTTHLAELMGNHGSIVAADVSQIKLRQIESNCQRLGVTIVSTLLSEQAGSLQAQDFDVVLADVPCSNTGVLARRAEARWRFSEQALSTLVRDQKALAQLAAGFVRPGGRLIYSTCSIEPEECGAVARWLAQLQPRLKLVKETLTLPGGAEDPTRWHDGGYVAELEA